MKVFSFIKFDTQHATQIHIIWVWNFQLSRQIVFRKRFWKIFFLYIFPCKLLSSFPLHVVIHPIATQRNRLEFIPPEDASTQVLAFQGFWFVKILFCIYFHVWIYIFQFLSLFPLHVVTPSYPSDHDLKKLESTIPKDFSTQVSTFQAHWFLRRRFFKYFSWHIPI